MFNFYKRKRLIRNLNTLTSAILGCKISQTIKSVKFNGKKLTLMLEIPHKSKQEVQSFESEIHNIALLSGFKKEQISLIISSKVNHPQKPQTKPLAGVKNIICVASCKGGVGKSTVALNIAQDYAKKGLKVGILDGDIYGPSIPLMMKVENFKPKIVNLKFIPAIKDQIKVFSMAFLVEQEKALMWRGSMVTKTIRSFFEEVEWGELDVLVVDLPPGTGDIYLSLLSTYKVNGAVLVSSPHKVAVEELKKTVNLLSKFNIKILATVENMIEDQDSQLDADFKVHRKSIHKEGFVELNLNFAEKISL